VDIAKEAVQALEPLSHYETAQTMLRKLGAVRQLVWMLRGTGGSEDAVTQLPVVRVLSVLSSDAGARVDVVKHGAMPVLLNLLSSPFPELKKAAVDCVVNMSAAEQVKQDAKLGDGTVIFLFMWLIRA